MGAGVLSCAQALRNRLSVHCIRFRSITNKEYYKIMQILSKAPLTSMIMALAFSTLGQSPAPGVIKSEFIYETAPFPECHASTIAESKGKLVAAWFGGTKEKHPDVGIWVSRAEDGKWTAPGDVANGGEC